MSKNVTSQHIKKLLCNFLTHCTGRFFPLFWRCGGACFGRSGIPQNKTCAAAPRIQREKSPGTYGREYSVILNLAIGHRWRPRDLGYVKGRSGRGDNHKGEHRPEFPKYCHHIREGRGDVDQPHWQIKGQGTLNMLAYCSTQRKL